MIKEVHETVLWHLGSMTFHGKTLVMTWISMAAVMVFVLLGVRNLTSGKPGKMQNVLEWIVDFVRGIINDNMDYEKGRPLLSYLVTLFMFVFFSNMLGLIPNFTFGLLHDVHFAQLGHIFATPGMMSPTADINTTMSLALLTIFWFSIWVLRLKDSIISIILWSLSKCSRSFTLLTCLPSQ